MEMENIIKKKLKIFFTPPPSEAADDDAVAQRKALNEDLVNWIK